MQKSSVESRRASSTIQVNPKRAGQVQQVASARSKHTSKSRDPVSISNAVQKQHARRMPHLSEVSKEKHARRAIQLANQTEKVVKKVAKVPTVAGGVVGGVVSSFTIGMDTKSMDEREFVWRGGFCVGGAVVGGPVYAAAETVAQVTMIPTAASIGQHWLKKHGKRPEPSSYGPAATIKSARRKCIDYADGCYLILQEC